MASIASGSNGNCYYVENDDDAVLIDAGVSTKQIVGRMARLGLSLSKLRGVFISHEHTDHIRGIDVFSRKHAVPVFMTQKTHASSGCFIKDNPVSFFSPGKPVQMGSIRVHPFLKSHDAIEPCGFSVSSGSSRVAVLTDVGLHCENVIEHIRNADALFLESNYDDQMLKTGPYPVHLKKRIASDRGHLSNTQAGMITLEYATTRLKHVFLSHLSANNNTPELALATFRRITNERSDLKLEVRIASREKESPVVCL
ncbi:MAG: MBL fold metallo-hydrolase [Smithellaceae bacterium]|nr:MBL fold metallo-hydrolase [Smithellaceae bacterium]